MNQVKCITLLCYWRYFGTVYKYILQSKLVGVEYSACFCNDKAKGYGQLLIFPLELFIVGLVAGLTTC